MLIVAGMMNQDKVSGQYDSEKRVSDARP